MNSIFSALLAVALSTAVSASHKAHLGAANPAVNSTTGDNAVFITPQDDKIQYIGRFGWVRPISLVITPPAPSRFITMPNRTRPHEPKLGVGVGSALLSLAPCFS